MPKQVIKLYSSSISFKCYINSELHFESNLFCKLRNLHLNLYDYVILKIDLVTGVYLHKCNEYLTSVNPYYNMDIPNTDIGKKKKKLS